MEKLYIEQFKRGLQKSLDGKGDIVFDYTNSADETKLRKVTVEKIDDTFKGFTFRGIDKSVTTHNKYRQFILDRVSFYHYLDTYTKPYIISVKTTGYWIDEYEVLAEDEEQARERYNNGGGYQLNDSPMAVEEWDFEIESVRPDFIEEDWDNV